jgi:hypothetical protein
MNWEQETIKGTTYHTLNYIVLDLMGYCFRLAFEKELGDLKGLVDPDSICGLMDDGTPGDWDVEYELLDNLEDEAVKLLMNSIKRLIECREVLRMINNLEAEEVVTDEYAIDEATHICWCADFEQPKDESYTEMVLGTALMYTNFHYRLFVCAFMFMQNKVDVDDEEMCAALDDNLADILNDRMVTEDKNARLLLDLIQDLNGHERLIDHYYDHIKLKE